MKTYDFSALYTTIPHDKLKSRLLDIIDNCFFNKNGKRKYSYLVISQQKHYFVKYHSDSTHKYSEVKIKKMLEFLIDNIHVVVGGQVFQQSTGFPMGTNCAPLLADLFLYSYETELIQKLLHEKKKSLAVAFNSTFRYIDDVLSVNTTHFHLCRFDIFQWTRDQRHHRVFYIRFIFWCTINFPYLCSNIPASPAYGVYISQLIRYARACSTHHQSLGSLLTKELMSQGFRMSRLQAVVRKFYGRYNGLIYPYSLSLGRMLSDMFHTNR
jgi:hypothetical protein